MFILCKRLIISRWSWWRMVCSW